MHELAFAEQILTSVVDAAAAYPGARIRRVRLSAGKYLGLDRDSLTFCLDAISSGTPLEDAEIELTEVGPEFMCPACGRVPAGEEVLETCPQCGAAGEMSRGTDLFIEEIELDDEEDQA